MNTRDAHFMFHRPQDKAPEMMFKAQKDIANYKNPLHYPPVTSSLVQTPFMVNNIDLTVFARTKKQSNELANHIKSIFKGIAEEAYGATWGNIDFEDHSLITEMSDTVERLKQEYVIKEIHPRTYRIKHQDNT